MLSAPGKFWNALVKIHSYLRKASCFILLLMQQLFLYWSSVGQENGKYSDHLSERSSEDKCSVPLENFRMLWLKIHSYLQKLHALAIF